MVEIPEKKPVIAQDLYELTDTLLPAKAADAVLASGGDWVKAVRDRQMPSRDVAGFSAHQRHSKDGRSR